ncbi:growth factor receptor-bound protein 10 isoform X1 [Gadus morhua]|uniref:Growth factor receptor-bound protein 10-like n=1 Tax=Gadus morhua TaxID=8049 RepID=A0A8C4ZH51_GADMO|nr:growth factor receptor-bound protein 10-like isoform X1 [Gadus morhua]
MALAGCPDYFLPHPNYQEAVDRTPAHRPEEGFQRTDKRTHHHDDDVDLEQLVNEMNASAESVHAAAAACADTVPLLHNGLTHRPHHPHPQQQQPRPRPSLQQHVPGGHSHAQRPLPQSSSRGALPHSLPMQIQAVRRLQGEHQVRPSSLPAIPNPFPELCSPSGSPILSPIQISDNHIVKVWSEDGAGKVLEILAEMTARDVCQLLVYKSHCLDDNCWTLVEHYPLLGLERCVEDHELVVQVQLSMGSEGKFLFRKNFAKYEFFRNPLNFFPEQMVAWCQESNGSIPPSQLLQNFLDSSSCPEIQGHLYLRETGRRSWKKLYMFLRRSGLYYSTKGTSKEPRHLQLLADLEDNNMFTAVTARKAHNAPTDYQFSIKPSKARSECKELKMLCAEDEQSRTCWTTAFRLLKHGISLYHNYTGPQSKKPPLSSVHPPQRSVSENSLVAMDFSGRTGRVIDNPAEAQSAAMEEGQSWRKRSQRLNVLGSPGPLHTPSLSAVIHRTQLWFHGRIVREEAQRMMVQQGQVDGLFLLRDSQSNPKAFVLTLCHHQKTKHFQILPYEEEGQVFFSLDDGATKFTDLIHLVDFYELNRGVLPCRLKHPCTAVAL